MFMSLSEESPSHILLISLNANLKSIINGSQALFTLIIWKNKAKKKPRESGAFSKSSIDYSIT